VEAQLTTGGAQQRKRTPAINSNHPSRPKTEVTRDGRYDITGSLLPSERWIVTDAS
jgi:hypothetical protein